MKNESQKNNFRESVAGIVLMVCGLLGLLSDMFYADYKGYILSTSGLLYIVAIILLLPRIKRELERLGK